jgi:hypothetical protein
VFRNLATGPQLPDIMLESPFVNRTGISVIAEGRHDGKDPIAEHVPSNPVDRKALLTIDPSVIFVHGLGGDPTDSWTHENKKSDQKTHRTIFRKHKSTNASSSSENGPPMGTSVFWPQHLLPEEIPNVRVMTYGYDSDPVKFFGPVNRTNLYSHAMTMLGDVVGCRTTSDVRRPRTDGIYVPTNLLDKSSNHLDRTQSWGYLSERCEYTT